MMKLHKTINDIISTGYKRFSHPLSFPKVDIARRVHYI